MSGSMGIEPKIAMARQAYQSVLSQLLPSDEAALSSASSPSKPPPSKNPSVTVKARSGSFGG
jgi:hypothetical protein